MVKKSFFARLFGHHNGAQDAPPRRGAAPHERHPGPSSAQGRTATKSRLPDVDFDDGPPAPARVVRTENGGALRGNGKQDGRVEASSNGSLHPPGSEAERATGAPAANGPGVQGVAVPSTSVATSAPPTATEMPRNEELALRLQEGFTGLSSVLRGIDTKIDQQQKTSEELIVSVRKIPEMMKDVPDASRAGLELLSTISHILEFQGRSTQELLSKMQSLPGSLDAMEQRVQSQVNALAKASHDADRTARETQHRLTSAFDGVKRVVEDVQVTTTRRQDSLVDELRRHQSAQDARVEELLKRMGNSTKLVVFLMIVAIAALLVAVYGMHG